MLLCEIFLCELLHDDKVVPQIKKFKRLFLRFTHENQKAQKYLMGGIEKTIETKKEELLPKVSIASIALRCFNTSLSILRRKGKKELSNI